MEIEKKDEIPESIRISKLFRFIKREKKNMLMKKHYDFES